MSKDLVLYYNPFSRGRIAHLMLEEVGQPYEMRLLDFQSREHKTPEYLALNPMGKIPTLVHKGVVVTEVAAIITYLADAFPAAGLAPAFDDPARGTYLRWLFFGAGCVEPALTDRAMNRAPIERTGAVGYGTYEDTVNALEKAITPGPYILGDRFSAADVYIGAQIGWGLFNKSLEPRPAFAEYVGRLQARPAQARVNAQTAVYGEEIKARQAANAKA